MYEYLDQQCKMATKMVMKIAANIGKVAESFVLDYLRILIHLRIIVAKRAILDVW